MDRGTLIRTVLLFITWVNALLVSKGFETLPVVSEEGVALFLTFITSLWTWWKNNYISAKGKAQKASLERQNLS